MRASRVLFRLCPLLLAPALLGWFELAPAKEAQIQGLWTQFEAKSDLDPVRFYYFHDGGIGLFRYGKKGLNQTHSFTYEVEGDLLRLTFTKTGAEHQTEIAIKEEGARVWLELDRDPRMGGAQRYFKEGADAEFVPIARPSKEGEHPFARLWIEKSHDTKGQVRFNLYQLEAPTIDGRGVGWFHSGDFMDWSTEALTYRRTKDSLELFFPVRNERVVTPLVEGQRDGERFIHLIEDPRNFWHPRVYEDGGPGFTVRLQGGPLPYRVHRLSGSKAHCDGAVPPGHP